MIYERLCIQDLAAPDRGVRLFALEEAIRHGRSEEMLRALQARQAQEDDGECRVLLGHAVLAVQTRLGIVPAAPAGPGASGVPAAPGTPAHSAAPAPAADDMKADDMKAEPAMK